MDEERITLDREAFRALASESRVSLLKALDERRKTSSELSRELGLRVQSVSEHLARLEEAQLARRVETERKWVYYELTPKGRGVLHPESSRARVWVVLGLTLLALGGFALVLSQIGGVGTLSAGAPAFAEQKSLVSVQPQATAPFAAPLATPKARAYAPAMAVNATSPTPSRSP